MLKNIFNHPRWESRFVRVGLRLILGGTFLAAGVIKIAMPEQFIADVDNYRILPSSWVFAVANFLPWVEFATGACVITGVYVRQAAFAISLLSLVFLGATISALARGLDIQCGCFGTFAAMQNGMISVATESALLGMSLMLAQLSPAGAGAESPSTNTE